MPVKRRIVKARAELTAAQQAFLRDEDLPERSGFADRMRLTWLRAEWRDRGDASEAMPDGSPSARELWAAYGAEVMADRPIDRPPHPALRRFGVPA